ncbi:MAG: glpD [Ramlibacter sp.]|jgi:glycerol-3-phosphate dehydrogenase|nr:glpD [Ramlibacter sp.]
MPAPSDATTAPSAGQTGGDSDCDVLVVGGGINGAGIARDLAGRGWRVILCEQDDLASHTSSASTKLIHGGLRYLEYYEFSLVRKALAEREVLLRSAPHIIHPLRFVMPHDPSMRPAWMIRAGLFLYDNLARRDVLPGTATIDLRGHELGACLRPHLGRAFVYSDGWVDDARLVVLAALDARQQGAHILTRTRCEAAQRDMQGWTARLRPAGGPARQVRARALVNAAGPWAESFLRREARGAHGETLASRSLRLVKGSHIVIARRFEHDHAYVFQNADKRIIFAIPYEGRFTLIGTTDVELQGEPRQARIDADETHYLCAQASRYFNRPVYPSEVVWSYSGVRPLLDDASGDASAVTRDYLLDANTEAAPLLTIWGGKITTFRKLAEDAAAEVGRMLGDARRAWTGGALLPGGDFSGWIGPAQRPDTDFTRFVAEVRKRYTWPAAAQLQRMARAYGSRVDSVLTPSAAGMGAEVAPGLFEAELDYLHREEWATNPDDVLWRRSKLGLHYSAKHRDDVAHWMAIKGAGDRKAA